MLVAFLDIGEYLLPEHALKDLYRSMKFTLMEVLLMIFVNREEELQKLKNYIESFPFPVKVFQGPERSFS